MVKVVPAKGSPSSKSALSTKRGNRRRPTNTCNTPTCTKNPYFGWFGEKAVFCVTHKETGMVDVKNKRCEEEACMKRGLFGYDGEKARFCGGHRLEGMIDLKNKRCKSIGCAKQANFAEEGKTTASFCSKHRSPEMVDVKGRRCESDKCTKLASFGVEGQGPVACVLHRRARMVEMIQPRIRRAAVSRSMTGNRSRVFTDEYGGGSGRLLNGSNRDAAGHSLPLLLPPLSSLAGHCGGGGGGDGVVGSGGARGGMSGLQPKKWSLGQGHAPTRSSGSVGDIDHRMEGQAPRPWGLGSDSSAPAKGGGGGGDGHQYQQHPHQQQQQQRRQLFGPGWGNAGVSCSDVSNTGSSCHSQQLPSMTHTASPLSVAASTGARAVNASVVGSNRIDGGGSHGSYAGDTERVGMDTSGDWRSTAFSEGFQQQHFPAATTTSAAQQTGYAPLPSPLNDARGGGGVVPTVKNEHSETNTSGDLGIPDVPETEAAADVWLEDLIQGTLANPNNAASGPGLHQQQQHHHRYQQQHYQHQHQQFGMHGRGPSVSTARSTSSLQHQQQQQQQQQQRLGALNPSAGKVGEELGSPRQYQRQAGSTATPATSMGPYRPGPAPHHHQQQQQQQQQQQASMLFMGGADRMHDAGSSTSTAAAAAAAAATSAPSTNSSSSSTATTGRSASTFSYAAPDRVDSYKYNYNRTSINSNVNGSSNDRHHGNGNSNGNGDGGGGGSDGGRVPTTAPEAGTGAGFPNLASRHDGGASLVPSTGGPARGVVGPPSQLAAGLTGSSLPGVHGVGGLFHSDVQFSPLPSGVASPSGASWGGF